MASPVIQVKRGLYSNLPALKSGEPGFTTDKYDLFVGLDETLGNNQFFGSGRYWEREDGTNAAQLKLVDKDGSNGINLQVPDTTAGIGTWILPNSNTGSQYGLLAIASTSGDERTLEWTSITTNSFDATTLVIESEGISSNDSDTQIPTTAAVKDYVDTQITAQDLDFAGDTGTGAVDLDSQSFTIAGTSNEIETSASGQTITIGLPDDVTIGDTLTVTGISTFTGQIDGNGGADISGGETTLSSATVSDLTSGRVVLAGTSGAIEDSANLTFDGTTLSAPTADLTNATIDNLTFTSGTAITSVDTDLSTVSASDDTLASAKAIKSYVDGEVSTAVGDVSLGFAGDTGTGAVDLDSQTFTIAGTANEIETSGSGQTLTIGLPNDVTVSNNLTVSNNVTVQGNLTVNGTTTQVNTSEVSVYDRTITLGIQTGSTPTTTTWDLGVMMQYGDAGVAKTAGVIWEYSTERFQFSANSNNPSSGTNTTAPQITVATFAPIEIGSLWVNDCAGQSQVISCTGSTRNLENITVDAGSF